MSRHLSRWTWIILTPVVVGVALLLFDVRGLSLDGCFAAPLSQVDQTAEESRSDPAEPADAAPPVPASAPASEPATTSSPPAPSPAAVFTFDALALLDVVGRSSAQQEGTDATYRRAAEALRRGDCRAALEHLAGPARPDAPRASFARVVRGLHAEACGELELARDLLFLGGGRDSVLEDWRLLGLGRVAFQLNEEPVAQAALDTLLDRYPASPLWPEALAEAARQAREAGRLQRLYSLMERGVEERLDEDTGSAAVDRLTVPREIAIELYTLAWEAAGEVGDEGRRRQVGRRLLVEAPATAEDLDVPDLFRGSDNRMAWGSLLTADELGHRARALAGERRYDEARENLEAVASEERDFDWRLQMAALLVRDHRGAEALAVLDPLDAGEAAKNRARRDPHAAALVAWHRARAERDLATYRRGRTNRPAAERQALQQQSWDHLREVVALDTDPDLMRAALRRLFTDLVDEDFHDAALEVLKRLRRQDPADATGADWLWRQGWESFQRRSHSSAIGWWAELEDLYPEHRLARSGRYWTGRAFDALGQRTRAREIYRQVADADTMDFYRRYALDHLQEGLPPADQVPGQEPAPWPWDPRLTRAQLLTEVGLDAAASTELETVLRAAWREPSRAGEAVREASWERLERAGHALESEILARQGKIRASIGPIRRAFPALGGPYQAAVPERALRLYYPLAYEEAVRAQAEKFDVPLHVLYGMIRQESGFDPTAHSRAGARGLLQLMPATGREVARRIGLRYSYRRLSDPHFNVAVGAAYFRQVLTMFDDQLELALAGYNGGPYRIKRLWRRSGQADLPHFLEGLTVTESRIYVKRILVLSDSYRQLYDLESAHQVARAGDRVIPAAAVGGVAPVQSTR